MKEYVIEYNFSENDAIKRYVTHESGELRTVLAHNTPGDEISFMDPYGNYYSFNISQVKYTKVYLHR